MKSDRNFSDKNFHCYFFFFRGAAQREKQKKPRGGRKFFFSHKQHKTDFSRLLPKVFLFEFDFSTIFNFYGDEKTKKRRKTEKSFRDRIEFSAVFSCSTEVSAGQSDVSIRSRWGCKAFVFSSLSSFQNIAGKIYFKIDFAQSNSYHSTNDQSVFFTLVKCRLIFDAHKCNG